MNIDFVYAWKNTTCNQGNRSEYLLCPCGTDDYLHVLYPPLDRGQIKKLFKAVERIKSPPSKSVASYEAFLQSTNGAELYSGSIVLFGYAEKDILGNEEGLPASLLDENASDATSKILPQVLYVGNAVFSAKKNVHFYLNLDSGLVAGAVDGTIEMQWADFDSFLNHVCQAYDANYSTDTGRHLYFNQREKGVINNIQCFTLNI